MRTPSGLSFAIAGVLIAGSAQAGDVDLCDSLKAAWTAARTDPASVEHVKFPGADRCSFSDNDLRCFWISASPEAAHRQYDDFRSLATSCFAPLGLSAVEKVLGGVETTSLQPKAEEDPTSTSSIRRLTPSSASASSRHGDPRV